MRRGYYGLLLTFATLLILAGCSTTGGNSENEPPEFVFQVTSGGTSTTASPERVAELPFDSEVVIDLIFEKPLSGPTQRAAIRVTTAPTFWRVSPRTTRAADTYSFAITNSSPGTVVVTIQLDADSDPVDFTLQIGEVE